MHTHADPPFNRYGSELAAYWIYTMPPQVSVWFTAKEQFTKKQPGLILSNQLTLVSDVTRPFQTLMREGTGADEATKLSSLQSN